MLWGLGLSAGFMAVVAGLFVANGSAPPLSFLITLVVALLSLSAIPLLVMGLQDFKHQLRRAFTFICLGIALYSLAPLQFPLVNLFHLQALANTGVVVIPYIVAVSFLFWGVRRFGRLLQLRGLWFSPWWAFVVSTVVAVGVTFLPHVHSDLPPAAFATVNALNMWCGMVLLFAAMGIVRIRQAAASQYRLALTWLLAGVGVNVFAAVHYLAINLLLPTTNGYAVDGALLPALIGAACFIQAGYAFTKIKLLEAAVQANASAIDVMIYVAGLASNPHQIDQPLNALRQVTATLPAGGAAALDAKQEARLATAYQQIEDYLVTAEPLREFTRPGLREIIRTKFQFKVGAGSSFWQLFAEPTAR